MNPLKALLLPLILLLAAPAAAGAGFVPVRNFHRDDYGGGAQNWAMVQDSTGRIYIGNRDGLLCYDGRRWTSACLDNLTTVRSLMFDPEEHRIYAGGSEEMGFFAPDHATGRLVYTSLLPLLGRGRPRFTEVWNIHRSGKKIWFQADFHIFCLEDTSLRAIASQRRISTSAMIADVLYVAFDDGGIDILDSGSFKPLPGTGVLKGKKIAALLPWRGTGGDILVATAVDGLFITGSGSTSPLPCDIAGFLKENRLFSAAAGGENYVFGTVNRGAVVKNFAKNTTHYINKESGMQNNTVLDAAFDRDGNLWLCLDNGVDFAVYNSPVTNLMGSSNFIGAGYCSLLDGSEILFGTNQGLYSTTYPLPSTPAPPALTRRLDGQIWSIERHGAGVFVCADAGLFERRGNSFVKIEGVPGTYHIEILDAAGTMALASTYHRFHFLRNDGSGWRRTGELEGYDDIGGRFCQDSDGYIWLTHWRKGVYRLKLDRERMRFSECVLLNTADGLPSDYNNRATIYNGRVAIANESGFYTFDPSSSRIVPDAALEAIFGKGRSGELIRLPGNALLLNSVTDFDIAIPGGAGKYDVTTIGFDGFADKVMPGYLHLDYIGPHELIASNQDGFWNIDTRYRRPAPESTEFPFVSEVWANRDSLVYRAPLVGAAARRLQLPYSFNSLRIDFAIPEYHSLSTTEFSSMLEGYDSRWTPYSPESSREYTQLPEGKYTFRLRARNLRTGAITETAMTLRIMPPWYRSLWAWIFYALLTLMIIVDIVYITRKRIAASRRRFELEQQQQMEELRKRAEQEALVKDYEIATLKSEQLEHDIKHKSQELSSTTMNLIRKNEILNEIASKIAKLQEITSQGATPDAIESRLARIQSSIEENISHDDDWKTFTRNFDVVYENYTARLLDRHPNLSQADIRICCYIKMGLSSKEIAPLVNISYKSVEMARYRLRKKMELGADTSLSAYLANV